MAQKAPEKTKKKDISDFPSQTLSVEPHTHLGAAGNWERFTSRHEPTARGIEHRKHKTQPLPVQLRVCE